MRGPWAALWRLCLSLQSSEQAVRSTTSSRPEDVSTSRLVSDTFGCFKKFVIQFVDSLRRSEDLPFSADASLVSTLSNPARCSSRSSRRRGARPSCRARCSATRIRARWRSPKDPHPFGEVGREYLHLQFLLSLEHTTKEMHTYPVD